MAWPTACAPKDILNPPLDLVQGSEQADRIQVSLDRYVIPDCGPRIIQVYPPIDTDDVTTRLAHEPKQRRCARPKVDQGHTLLLHTLEDELDVRQHIFFVVSGREAPYPTIKELNRLGARLDLELQVIGHHARQFVHQSVPGLRLAVHKLLGHEVLFGAAPFNGITSQGERRPRKSDERHPAAESLAGLLDRIPNVCQCAPIADLQPFDIGSVPDGVPDNRSLPFGEFEADAHGLQWQQNIGENNRGIHRKPFDRLERNLGS